MKKLYLLLSIISGSLFTLPQVSYAQSSCPNLDFSMGNFTNWQCCTSRCTIMNAATLLSAGQFYDKNCPLIPKVPNGYNFSCLLGPNPNQGGIDAIEYELMVDSNNSLLLVNYAAIHLECELSHPLNDRQRLIINIKDSVNNILPIPCANIDFLADTFNYMKCPNLINDARRWNKRSIN